MAAIIPGRNPGIGELLNFPRGRGLAVTVFMSKAMGKLYMNAGVHGEISKVNGSITRELSKTRMPVTNNIKLDNMNSSGPLFFSNTTNKKCSYARVCIPPSLIQA